jgi:RHS repeat-associated protein
MMRDGQGEIAYLLGDHLGSVSAVLDETGVLLSSQRFLPFGAVRGDAGTITETDFGYTGQREYSSLGLLDYHARWYSPSLGRFVQADTLVPDLFDPQSLNRYSYVLNNPLKYVDPSGHILLESPEDPVIPSPDHPDNPAPIDPYPDTESDASPGGGVQPAPVAPGPVVNPEKSSYAIEKELQEDKINQDFPKWGSKVSPTIKDFYAEDEDKVEWDNGELLSHSPRPINNYSICPGGLAAGIPLALLVGFWDITLLYVAWNLAPTGPIMELVLLPIEIATFELNIMVIQLVAQSMERDCPDLDIRPLPPWEFGAHHE